MRIEVEGNTIEWLAQRHGCLTASCLQKVVDRLEKASGNRKKGDYKASRDTYMREVISERLGGLAIEHFVTGYMAQGTENEPLAREAYSLTYDADVSTKYGFATHPEHDFFGASLDGTIGDTGGLEIKCFKPDKHIYIMDETKEIPEDNIAQVLGEIACYELDWLDWVSYCGFGKWPRELRIFRRRLTRADTITFNNVTQTVDSHIADIEAEAKKFLEDVILRMGRLAVFAKQKDAVKAYEEMEESA